MKTIKYIGYTISLSLLFSHQHSIGMPMNMKPVETMSPEIRSLADWKIEDYPLEGKVERILQGEKPQGWAPTLRTREDYLDIMEPVVLVASEWINEKGALIDPVIKREWNQSTPRFVSSVSILLYFGRVPELKETAYRAMTYCCKQLSTAKDIKSKSPDFWMRELITAYDCLATFAPAEKVSEWKELISNVYPESTYANVDHTHKNLERFHNWAVYSSAGESMRELAGVGCSKDVVWGNTFFDIYMNGQIHRLTSYGMYRDPNDPITYDITTRLQFAAAIARGYDGALRANFEEILRRGNLTMLQFVSPDGYVPFGGRSSQFHFQEAIVSAMSELEALRYKEINPKLAGAFKRQARQCAQIIKPWFNECKPFRHLKNRFDPKTRHGCDRYGQYSVYSMLATSYFGLAALYADDTIEEHPTPAEIGGYSLALYSAFHKTLLCAHGTFVEVDTKADEHYDATGIGRIQFKDYPPYFPFGLPFSTEDNTAYAPTTAPSHVPLAFGPTWQSPDGDTYSLASWGERSKAETLEIEGGVEITYRKNDTVVIETIRIDNAGAVTAEWCVTCDGQAVDDLAIIVPVLVHDGELHATLQIQDTLAKLAFDGKAVTYEWNAGLTPTLGETEIANRNGIYRVLSLKSLSNLCSVRIAPVKY